MQIPVLVYKPKNARTGFQNTAFLTDTCRLNWKTRIKLNQWHEFDKNDRVNLQIELLQEQILIIRVGVGDLKQFHQAPFFMFGVGHSSSGDALTFETGYNSNGRWVQTGVSFRRR